MHGILGTLFELLIILGVSTIVVVLFNIFRLPAVAGFILSGAIVGPYGFSWIAELERVHVLAEIGVILLLFSLGVEFSSSKLRELRRAFFGLGSLQCILTTLFVFVLCKGIGFETGLSLLCGFLVSLSSTAIVFRLLQQRRETHSPQGKVSIAVLLFQDLWVILLLVLLPLIAGKGTGELSFLKMSSLAVIKACGLIAFVYLGAKYFVPFVLRIVAKTQVRELFLIAVALLSLGTALFTAQLGLSLALGAFAAGIMISESEFGHQAVADVIPLRDVFVALFFVSVGMLLDFRFLTDNFMTICLIALGVLSIKFLTTASSASFLGFHSRIAALVGIYLAQIGEFSFILAESARQIGLMNDVHYQYFLAVTLVLMFIAPSLIRFAPLLAPGLSSLDFIPRLIKPIRKYFPEVPYEPDGTERIEGSKNLINHVLIIGYGINGQSLSGVLSNLKIPCSIIEMNHNNVIQAKQDGYEAIFGDASREEVLVAGGVLKARMVVVAISDPVWGHQVVRGIRRLRSDIHILVRSHYYHGIEQLEAAGASDLVVGELEAGMELFSRVLRYYGVPDASIERSVKRAQAEKYRSLKKYITKPIETEGFMGWLSSTDVWPVIIPESSPVIGLNLGKLRIREKTGAIVVTVYGKDFGYQVPDPQFTFHGGDIVYLVGTTESVQKAENIFTGNENGKEKKA